MLESQPMPQVDRFEPNEGAAQGLSTLPVNGDDETNRTALGPSDLRACRRRFNQRTTRPLTIIPFDVVLSPSSGTLRDRVPGRRTDVPTARLRGQS